jgi:hypothetical protein
LSEVTSNGRVRPGIGYVIIISVLATSGFWNVAHQYLINDKPSRDEVKSIVKETSPYAADKSMILQTLADLREGQKDLKVEMEKIRGELQADRKLRR